MPPRTSLNYTALVTTSDASLVVGAADVGDFEVFEGSGIGSGFFPLLNGEAPGEGDFGFLAVCCGFVANDAPRAVIVFVVVGLFDGGEGRPFVEGFEAIFLVVGVVDKGSDCPLPVLGAAFASTVVIVNVNPALRGGGRLVVYARSSSHQRNGVVQRLFITH